MSEPTRTERGYEAWKESPKAVAAARTQANGRIAQKYLREALILSWAVPAVEWLNTRLRGDGNA